MYSNPEQDQDRLLQNYLLTFPQKRYDELTPEAQESLLIECKARVVKEHLKTWSDDDTFFYELLFLLRPVESASKHLELLCLMHTIDKALPPWMIQLEYQDIKRESTLVSLQHRALEDRNIFWLFYALLFPLDPPHERVLSSYRRAEVCGIYAKSRGFYRYMAGKGKEEVQRDRTCPSCRPKHCSGGVLARFHASLYGSPMPFIKAKLKTFLKFCQGLFSF